MHLRRALPLAAILLCATAVWALPPGLTQTGGVISMQPIADSEGAPPEQRPGNLSVLSAADHEIFSRAFQAADHGDWLAARALAAQGHDATARQLVQWRYLLDHNSGASFAEIDAFIKQNPDWPLRDTLIARAETAITPDMPPAAVLAWFGTRNAVTPMGRIRLGEALAATGQSARARELIRQGWIDGSFDAPTELAIVQRDGQFLTPDADRLRIDNLLWRGDIASARRAGLKLSSDLLKVARMVRKTP